MTRHIPHRLNPRSLDKLPAGRHGDGHGLHLYVRASGERSWVQRLMIQGERVDLGLGGYPLVSLKEARETAFENRRMARRGEDPRRARGLTFREAQDGAITALQRNWKTDGNEVRKWEQLMRDHVLPHIGTVRVDLIEAPHVKRVLEPIHKAGGKVDRVALRISQTLEWARFEGHYRAENPVAAVKKHVEKKKAAPDNMRAIPHAEVADALAKADALEGTALVTRRAFRFLVLTAARTCEVRRMEWADVDLDTATWNRPADKMKAGVGHAVPLSDVALDVLRDALEATGGEGLVFPGDTGGILADNAMRKLTAKIGVDASPHGFRSSFRDWCGETGVVREVAEHCLAHAVGDQTERAYSRSDLLERRRDVMQAWADYLAGAGRFC